MHTTRVFARSATVLAICVGVLAVGVGMPAPGIGAVSTATTSRPATSQHRVMVPHHTNADSTDDPAADRTDSSQQRIDPDDSEKATQHKARTKVVLAIVTIGLLALVVFGRKKRNKRKISMRR